MCPGKGTGERSGASGVAEGAGGAQPGEKKAQGGFSLSLKLEGGFK